ncbi:hypothetical protein HYT52_04575, partial [Candidatus Woesearchaeota archaeon]|nr:hypothetical protein [Candidatus Woesearchaeota archaeon]
RAGESGKAITLLSENDFGVFGDILTRYRHLKIQEMPDEEFQKVQFDSNLGRGPRQRRGGFSRSNNNYSKSWGDRSNSNSSYGGNSRGSRNWSGPRRQGVDSRTTRSPGRDQYAWNSGD